VRSLRHVHVAPAADRHVAEEPGHGRLDARQALARVEIESEERPSLSFVFRLHFSHWGSQPVLAQSIAAPIVDGERKNRPVRRREDLARRIHDLHLANAAHQEAPRLRVVGKVLGSRSSSGNVTDNFARVTVSPLFTMQSSA